MTVESAADRAAFFDTDEFGKAATVTIAGSPTTVNGLLTTAFVEALADTEIGVESEQPVFICRESDVSGVDHDDPVTVNGTEYIVTSVEPDGEGMVKLLLQEV